MARMDHTTLLKLPYIMAAQAQKHVTHNEALRALDAVVQLGVLARHLAVPPQSPAEGDRYIVAGGAAEAWSGQEGAVAAWQDGAWAFYAPVIGWLAWVAEEGALLCWDGTGWIAAASSAPADALPMLGINAAADETNRLTVAGAATLLTHDGAGHQLKINKAAPGDTSSLLFQTNWSGRAEMGLAGDNNFSIKVSPDGATWKTALKADAAAGAVSVENLGVGVDVPLMPLHVAGKTVFGDSVNAARVTSGTPGNTGRALSLIDAGGAIRVWRRAVGGNSAVIELATGTGSDNIADTAILWWDLGVTHNTGRFEIRNRTGGGGGALVGLSIQPNMRIGIGTQSPHASAQVEVASTTRGFLLPRMTTAERNAVAAPAEGLMIYNVTDHAPQFWNGSAWAGM